MKSRSSKAPTPYRYSGGTLREKRQHQRAVLEVPVRVVPNNGTAWETHAFDISVGGISLAGLCPVDIGTEVKLIFELSKLGKVEMPGFVRWSSARGIGVQFGLIGPRETHAIGGLVRQAVVS